MSIEFANFDDLLEAVRGLPAMPVAVIDADERHVLEGACEAAGAGYVDPVLIGDENAIRSILSAIGCTSRFRIVHAPVEEAMAEEGVKLIENGEVKALMKGHIHTDEFLHPVLAHHLQGKRRISHVFLADMKTYPKLLYITDAAINISPDLATKMHIAQNAIDMAIVLGVSLPKVAVLSAVEVVNPAIPSTMDAACLAKMSDRGQITGAVVDGPLAFDNAISAESAAVKGIASPVSGDVDILVVPDLVSGNILGKDLEYLAGARMAGFVVGTKVPIILTSRSDPPQARLLSCAVAALAGHRME
ncbi:MAG TPA: bifunctional enoyl-CoA hydratase/phosphate acetyltransferase [Deltaproteobacteria bacterium]|nr:bifunctional enoyl-CoA hydratase/phosphate acetyltransferase [Deltaproteobacteria bacterium]HXK48092.1 bifunctional enoyl-CoA hydratase/phosphate acetyltransferase [Deltaproteobacteria bacterium]